MTARHAAGPAHVRYGHRCRPRDLEVACPRCGALATAKKASESSEPSLIGDMSPSWSLEDWKVACTACLHRASGLAYDHLPACYWTFDVGRIRVWAWNREHLEFLGRYLRGDSAESEPYAWLGTYVPGEWKLNAPRVVEAIAARLHSTRARIPPSR